MTPDELRARIRGITLWKRGDERAPHKPLLILYALARFAGGTRGLSFTQVERPLRDLLDEFGPPGRRHSPQYPFWRLQRDGLWSLKNTEGLVRRQSNSDPTLTSLRAVDPQGGFPDDVAAALRAHPDLIRETAHTLLDAHFPPSLHESISTP